MKKFYVIFGLMFCLASFSQNGEFSTYDLRKVKSLIQFKPVNDLAGLNEQ